MKKRYELIIVSLITFLISQIYVNIMVQGFRISLALVLFPIFLMLSKKDEVILKSIVTAIVVTVLRIIQDFIFYSELPSAFIKNYPAFIFYISYGIFFRYFNFKFNSREWNDVSTLWCCDFLSNVAEIIIRSFRGFGNIEFIEALGIIAVVAMIRTALVIFIWIGIKNYGTLLKKEEHEERYIKLTYMAASLKGEMAIMKQNMTHVEKAMDKAFTLYGEIEDPFKKEVALEISKEVHEIKKHYISIIRGLEETLELQKEDDMSIDDLMEIIKKSIKSYCQINDDEIVLRLNIKTKKRLSESHRIMTILSNLIVNAIESYGDFKKKKVITSISENDNSIIFSVRDEGKGIANSDRDHIFKPGFSTKFDWNTGAVNRGLGLTMVKDLVENYFRGTIKFESKEDEGSLFIIEIPKERILS